MEHAVPMRNWLHLELMQECLHQLEADCLAGKGTVPVRVQLYTMLHCPPHILEAQIILDACVAIWL